MAGLPPFGASLMLNGSEADARRSSSVMAIVNWAMTQGSEPSLNVERRNSDGEWEVVPDHPAMQIIRRPDPDNPKVTYAQMQQVFMESLVIGGNAYAYKLRSASGRVVGQTAIRGASIAPRVEQGVLKGYQVSLSNGQTFLAPPEDVIHVMDGQDPLNPFLGRSRMKEAAMSVATDREVQAYMLSVSRSPAPSVLISPKDTEAVNFGGEQAKEVKDRYTEMSSGNRAGGAIVPTIPMNVERLSYSPDDMALDRIQAYLDAKLAAIFGIPAMVIGLQVGLERSTFTNYAEAREAAVEQFLIPKWRLIAEALTMQLGVDFWGEDPNYRFAFDYENIRALSDDTDALYKRTTEAFLANAIDRATWKREVGMKPAPEDEGVYVWMLKGTDMASLMAGVVAGKRSEVPQ